jgi:hypothetical protein
MRRIEEKNDIAGAVPRLGRSRTRQEGASERKRQQNERQTPQGKQEGVANPASIGRPKGHLPQEHERRESGHLASLSLCEVDDDRNRQQGEPTQEGRHEEGHQ